MWSTLEIMYLHGHVMYTHMLVHLCTNNNELTIYHTCNILGCIFQHVGNAAPNFEIWQVFC